MKRDYRLFICFAFALAMSAFTANANADIILEYDSTANTPQDNGGLGALSALNVDSEFVSNPLSFIGNDGTTVQGVGSVATFSDGIVPTTATTVNGGAGTQSVTTTQPSPAGDVAFNINPLGGLTGTTADSLAGGNFIFFTFDAAQALELTELSALSDPNNGSGRNGARTAGAFVSVNGGSFTQFGSDNAVNNNALRTNTFTDTLSVASGDSVEVRLAFTNELFTGGFQAATRIGSISVSATAITTSIPEPGSLSLFALGALGLCGTRRRR